ncbi:uncharacterized protein EDB93DRAFT_1146747, partial [Suillus bovinus]|uniref:uncharacterized protein n=1 Tax=Suillus bovinus TaxID=48563 RepID=UPI001B8670AC
MRLLASIHKLFFLLVVALATQPTLSFNVASKRYFNVPQRACTVQTTFESFTFPIFYQLPNIPHDFSLSLGASV